MKKVTAGWPRAVVYVNPKTMEFYVEGPDAEVIEEKLQEIRQSRDKYKELYQAARDFLFDKPAALEKFEAIEKQHRH